MTLRVTGIVMGVLLKPSLLVKQMSAVYWPTAKPVLSNNTSTPW